MLMKSRLALLAGLLVSLSACSFNDRTSAPPTTAKADQPAQEYRRWTADPFYSPPADLADAEPGAIIRSEEVEAPPGTDARAWRVLYRSKSVAGASIAVSGLIIVPNVVAEGRPVVSSGHQILGLGDDCALSKFPTDVGLFNPGLVEFVRLGYIVGASDYEGLGTPGGHPMFVGTSTAHSLLDMALAVQRFGGARGSRNTVIVGDGQGAQGALIAAEIAPTYAPDVNLLGVVASSPVTDPLILLELSADFQGVTGFAVQGLLGFRAAYPDLQIRETLTPDAYSRAISVKDTSCWDQFLKDFPSPPAEVFAQRISDDPYATEVMRSQTAGLRKPTVPILIPEIQNLRSEPPGMVETYVNKACLQGGNVEYIRIDPPADGESALVIEAFSVPWVEARFAGVPAPGNCP